MGVTPVKDRKTARRRVHKGAVVNPLLCAPAPPGDWIDEERCDCGATYEAFRSGVEFHEGVHRLRAAAKESGDEGGGYRTECSVKWVLRVIKLERWYEAHLECGELLRPPPPGFCWECGAVCGIAGHGEQGEVA